MKTKTISNFGIIFAVALTMVTTAVFTACNSEDDFGGDFNGDITGEYSLATRMMTQRMEGEEGIKPTYKDGSASKSVPIGKGFYALVGASWEAGFFPMEINASISCDNNDAGNLVLTGLKGGRIRAVWTTDKKISVYINSTITITDTTTNSSASEYLTIVTIDNASPEKEEDI